MNQVNIRNNIFSWHIISRRCVHMAGTRFFARGIDQHGNTANFVETEQIVEFNGDKTSFVQVIFDFIINNILLLITN